MDRYEADHDDPSLRESRDLYAQAFDGARDDYYTGINAAAKSVFLGTPADLEKAHEYAARVLEIVGTNAWLGDYWKTATVADASGRALPDGSRHISQRNGVARHELDAGESSWPSWAQPPRSRRSSSRRSAELRTVSSTGLFLVCPHSVRTLATFVWPDQAR